METTTKRSTKTGRRSEAITLIQLYRANPDHEIWTYQGPYDDTFTMSLDTALALRIARGDQPV